MQGTTHLERSRGLESVEQRAQARMPMVLPILIVFEGWRYSAILQNLSSSGAKVATFAPLEIESKIEFHCGSICTAGRVAWSAGNKFGIKFNQSIDDRRLHEQFWRSEAVTTWRENRAMAQSGRVHQLVS